MSWVVTAVAGTVVASIGTTVYQNKQNKKAAKQAKKDALEADKQARKAEIFAETEGEGIGQLAQISMEVDDEEDNSSSVRI